MNFADPKQARHVINEWVTGKTQGKITEILPPGAPDPQTPLLLTDVIYFKGQWVQKFSKKQTETATFYSSSGNTLKRDFMHQLATSHIGKSRVFRSWNCPTPMANSLWTSCFRKSGMACRLSKRGWCRANC